MKGISYSKTKECHGDGDSFNPSQVFDNDLTMAAQDLWATCVDVFFHKDVSYVSTYDDQLQLRSRLNAEEGLVRKHNPMELFIPA